MSISVPSHLPRSIATVSLSGTLSEKLDAAAAIGFDAVEIFENDLLTFDGTPAEVRRIAADLGLAIDCTSRSAISRRCRIRNAAQSGPCQRKFD